MWGFSSSPLIAQGIVTVFAGSPELTGPSKTDKIESESELSWPAVPNMAGSVQERR